MIIQNGNNTMLEESREVAPARQPIVDRGGSRSVASDEPTSTGATVPTRTSIPIPSRYIADPREPLAPRGGDTGRGIADIILPRYLADAREPIAPRDVGVSRALAPSPTTPVTDTTPTPTPTTPQDQTNSPSSPFDLGLGDWFKSYFNEPIKGSQDKNGEFVYVPGATSGGGSSAMILLAVAGVGVGGYFLYKKYKGNG